METISRHTAKSIFEQQNDELLLKCLVAQRSEYSFTKKVVTWKGRLTILFILISILSSWLDIDWFRAFSCLMAVSVLIVSKHIDAFISTHIKHAADIQQYFDVVLYSGALGNSKSEWGPLLTCSDIANAVSEIDKSALKDVMNWYSDYSMLAAEQQVFHCQRENVRWDHKLRQEYKSFQIIFFAAIFAVMTTAFFWVNPTLIKLICIISGFIPIADYVVTNYLKVNGDIKRLSELEKSCEELELDIIDDSSIDINAKLISIQNKIHESRINSFTIPDWFYKYRQSKHQKKEDHIANVIQKTSKN
ncbi:MAG: S-4TM family putative pore-forming effector [Lachnospiraceae bacterium]|nr:S-4TM family putative pore-forming effector [Lachnospiraceae bacterium]